MQFILLDISRSMFTVMFIRVCCGDVFHHPYSNLIFGQGKNFLYHEKTLLHKMKLSFSHRDVFARVLNTGQLCVYQSVDEQFLGYAGRSSSPNTIYALTFWPAIILGGATFFPPAIPAWPVWAAKWTVLNIRWLLWGRYQQTVLMVATQIPRDNEGSLIRLTASPVCHWQFDILGYSRTIPLGNSSHFRLQIDIGLSITYFQIFLQSGDGSGSKMLSMGQLGSS